MRQSTVETGQGRWREVHALGLCFAEYLRLIAREEESPAEALRREPRSLDDYLDKGGFPEHVTQEASEDLRRRLRADIAEKAIVRDIVARGPERIDLDRVRRLFVYLVQDSGHILSLAERGRDLGAKPETISSWVQQLVDACLVHRVEPYVPASAGHLPSASARLSSKPKIYAGDHGMIPAFTLAAFPMAERLVRDRVFETVVLRHLLSLVEGRDKITYFRRGKTEVNFILRHSGKLCAVEVTSSPNPPTKKITALRNGASEIEADVAVLVHGGLTDRAHESLRMLPLSRFLSKPSSLTET